jgi:ABC-2 type transport system ATP-binding protein
MMSASAAPMVVSMRGVTKTYTPTPRIMRMLVRSSIKEDVVALDGVDFELAAGQTAAIVGPNGAGKTTMFRILTGLTTPTSGAARVLGLDAHRQSLEVRKHIGFMPAEDRSLFMRMTCLENLVFHARLQHVPRRDIVPRGMGMLGEVGLGDRAGSSVFSLSAGMRARLQLARALLHRPRLLILDEPTGAVDPVGAHGLLELVQGIVREHQLAALISSHRLEEIEALGANVVLLDAGRIRYQGDLDRLRAQWQRPVVELTFPSAGAAAAARGSLAGTGTEVEAGADNATLECHLRSGSTTGELLQALGPLAYQLVHVRESPTPLRDILAQMYSGARPQLEQLEEVR